MHAVVDNADTEEQCARYDAVGHHLEHATSNALGRSRENPHRDEAHMRNRGISNQLLDVFLHQGHQGGVDDGDDREREDQRREIMRGQREHRKRETQEAVTAHLQKDSGQDHRASSWRFDMCVGQPRVNWPHRQFHRERGEERQPRPGLQRARHGGVHQRRNISGAGIPVQRHDCQQHQYRAQQRVEEELEARVHPARATPHSNDQEHRDQAALEEQIEKHQVERAEGADHERFEQQESHHVFAHPHGDRFPARDDAKRHQGGGQDDERQRNAVHTHMIHNGIGQPRRLLDKLEVRLRGIEAPDQHQRHGKRNERGP